MPSGARDAGSYDRPREVRRGLSSSLSCHRSRIGRDAAVRSRTLGGRAVSVLLRTVRHGQWQA